ncbi:hypothetical protein [Sphingomonas sp. SUN039]|uniref:hypothetical protein n=1 Tax=Sphingomonas sp. SUN039 TaxID=2937787 RepID=UPI002164072D|nr:hypothetical protein [Sphingomonas sp. SUN039]UVO53212.1 hypothetical protein M0209_03395 [Sphingomonas sp. SUN039]
MKETRELEAATEARDSARQAMIDTSHKLRGRLAPRLLVAEAAELLAARAGRVLLKRGITKRRRITAAVGGAAAIASAIVLRAAHRTRIKKSGDLPSE